MTVTWTIVDKWRVDAGMEVSELARRAGIPERTYYMGRRSGARLRAASVNAIRSIFPDKFKQREEVQHG